MMVFWDCFVGGEAFVCCCSAILARSIWQSHWCPAVVCCCWSCCLHLCSSLLYASGFSAVGVFFLFCFFPPCVVWLGVFCFLVVLFWAPSCISVLAASFCASCTISTWIKFRCFKKNHNSDYDNHGYSRIKGWYDNRCN